MDDGTLIAPLSTLSDIFSQLVRTLAPLGLQVSLAKSTLWGPATQMMASLPTASLLHNITVVPLTPGSGVTLWGVPVHFPGAPVYPLRHVTDVIEKVRRC